MQATLYYKDDNDKEVSRTFETALPSHETGLVILTSAIIKFAWGRGIRHFIRIEFEGEETNTLKALAEAQRSQ